MKHACGAEANQANTNQTHFVQNISDAMQETWVRFLGQEDLLEKGMATHSLTWAIPWMEEPGGLQFMGSH